MSPKSTKTTRKETLLSGIGVSSGVAIGPVFLMKHDEARIVVRTIPEEEVEGEILRLKAALDTTRDQVRDIQDKLIVEIQDPAVFEAHLMVVEDPIFIEEIIAGIKTRKTNAEAVLKDVCDKYIQVFDEMHDAYLRERAADVRDVGRRIQRNLAGESTQTLAELKDPCILVANDLAPSDTASLDTSVVTAFATDLGSHTSHTAIMARALGIPAVVGLHDVSIRIRQGENVLIDGNKGLFIINPTPERLKEYGSVLETRRTIQGALAKLRDEPAITLDGYRMALSANIERPEDMKAVKAKGARGVGLFRTEFIYLSRNELPDEEEQVRAYEEVAKQAEPDPVIIRTIDLGGDKFASHLNTPEELNPFLGWRAIRFCLAQPEIFKVQLRAILRASRYTNIHLMYPMICKVEEVLEANKLLDEAKLELLKEGRAFNEKIEVGVMIEVPSAALSAQQLAQQVDFFSIGTNDLIQYTLAVDRINERIANLYEPTHPAILTLIKNTIDIGHDYGIWTGICGEMAGDPLMVPLLLGLGADELSVSPTAVPLVKDVIRKLRFSQAEELARKAMSSPTGAEVLKLCRELTRETAPEILELVS